MQSDQSELESDSKRKRKVSSIACDSCRRAKSKCSGSNPCDLCIKYKRECIYSPGKKRGPPPQSDTKKVRVDELLETNGVTVITNKYLDYFFSFMQKILGDFSCLSKNFLSLNSDSVAWHVQKYSIMSLCARSFGDVTAADHYFKLAISASKDVYDLCDSNDNFQIALGFVFLSLASSSANWKKVSHFAAVGKSFLDLCPQESMDEMQLVNRAIISLALGELCFAAQKLDPKGLSNMLETISTENVQFDELQEKFNLGVPKLSESAPQFTAYPSLWMRLQAIEKITLIKRVTLALFPNLKKVILSDTLNEDLEGLMKGGADKKVANFILDAIDKTSGKLNLPFSKLSLCSQRVCIYYSIGDTNKAVQYAKEYIKCLSSVNEMFITVSLTVVPITFLLSKMLLNEGHIDDVNNAIRFLSKFAGSFPNARTGMETLIRLQQKKLSEGKTHLVLDVKNPLDIDYKHETPFVSSSSSAPSSSSSSPSSQVATSSFSSSSSTVTTSSLSSPASTSSFTSNPMPPPSPPTFQQEYEQQLIFQELQQGQDELNQFTHSDYYPGYQSEIQKTSVFEYLENNSSDASDESIHKPFNDPSIETVYHRIHASMQELSTANGNDILRESTLEVQREDSDNDLNDVSEVFEEYSY